FRHSVVALIELGIKKKDTEKHERLSLESDCSLNIKNVTEEDYGLYICSQYVNDRNKDLMHLFFCMFFMFQCLHHHHHHHL
ncbi:hypothetical protein PO909_000516, partial [Leuciscus waleckii]